MHEAIDFDATLWRPPARWARMFVAVPFDVKARYGRYRTRVRVTIDGFTWRTTTVELGGAYQVVVDGRALIASQATVGDTVHIQMVWDDDPMPVEIPPELATRLRGDPRADAVFTALAPTDRRDYATWVREPKWPQTRTRRAEAVAKRLKSKGKPA